MKKIMIILIFISSLLISREELIAIEECEAFNNMRHSKNIGNITLNRAEKYITVRHYKGQYLTIINKRQRWIDDSCFSKSKGSVKTKIKKRYKKSSKQNLLILSWQNAFCETHRYKKECKRNRFSFMNKRKYSDTNFVLHGLWPQPRGNTYCNVDKKLIGKDKNRQWKNLPDLEFTRDILEKLKIVMPGYSSNLHKHEWIKHGTCYGKSANEYYKDSISLVEQINNSKIGEFFSKNIDRVVTLKEIKTIFNRSFGYGSGSRVKLKCKRGLITELWIYLGSGSDDIKLLLQKGKRVSSRCHKGRIDRVGFKRY